MANTMARYQALRPSLYDFEDDFRALTVPVLLALGDEDGPCLETNLMLKRAIPGAGLWIHPHTGHAINLEEPAAFNAMVGAFLADVDRGMAGPDRLTTRSAGACRSCRGRRSPRRAGGGAWSGTAGPGSRRR